MGFASFSCLRTVSAAAVSSGGDAVPGVILLSFSILAMPLTSLASVSAAVLFYAGRIVVGFVIGYLILKLLRKEPKELGRWQLLLGLVVLALLFTLPSWIGFMVYAFVAVVGAGAIVLGTHVCRREAEEAKVPSADAEDPPPETPDHPSDN